MNLQLNPDENPISMTIMKMQRQAVHARSSPLFAQQSYYAEMSGKPEILSIGSHCRVQWAWMRDRNRHLTPYGRLYDKRYEVYSQKDMNFQ
jgi:hypothetical protein